MILLFILFFYFIQARYVNILDSSFYFSGFIRRLREKYNFKIIFYKENHLFAILILVRKFFERLSSLGLFKEFTEYYMERRIEVLSLWPCSADRLWISTPRTA